MKEFTHFSSFKSLSGRFLVLSVSACLKIYNVNKLKAINFVYKQTCTSFKDGYVPDD